MKSTPVSGGAVVSDVMNVGQTPGPREPTLKRLFAHTAGQTLFRWLEQFCGMDEAMVRANRRFPGKAPGRADRVPTRDEIRNCAPRMNEEIAVLKPRLVIPVG
jgi:uracil-DNA glycosylase